MLEREKVGDMLHFEAMQSGSKWPSLPRPIGQVGCQNYKGGDDDVLGHTCSHGITIACEETLMIKENLRES